MLPIFLLLFLGVSSCSQKEERRILVIHSYEETYAAYPEFNRMIAEQFEKEKIDADIRTVYLDCESYWEEPELERMRFLVDSVSKDWRPEAGQPQPRTGSGTSHPESQVAGQGAAYSRRTA